MSSKIFTPINQVRLTNVSVVRLKKGGKRFELACYKNKVSEYRNKVTRDLDEILQSRIVFANVSKGQAAKETDIRSVFGADAKPEQIIEEILARGEVQVGSEEREQVLRMNNKEVATIVAEKCVNPRTKTPYPVGMIEQALADLHFSPSLSKSAKQQALEVIKLLEKQDRFPIARAQMRLLIKAPGVDSSRVHSTIQDMLSVVEEEEHGTELRMTCLIDPGKFRPITETVAKLTKGKGSVQVLNLKDICERPSPSPVPDNRDGLKVPSSST